MWTCVNGHAVRDGMFVCGHCGTDVVAEAGRQPDRSSEHPGTGPASAGPREAARVAARAELAGRLSTGVGLLVLSFIGAALSAVAVSDDDSGAAAILLAVASDALALVGAGFVLVAIVGHGVRLGIASSRTDRPED